MGISPGCGWNASEIRLELRSSASSSLPYLALLMMCLLTSFGTSSRLMISLPSGPRNLYMLRRILGIL